MQHRQKKRRALARGRWLRRHGNMAAGILVGGLLALCQAAWAQIGAVPMLALVFGANMALGALFGRALTMMRGTAQTEWRLVAMPTDGIASDWTPPPPPLMPSLPAHYRPSQAFTQAHIYGEADLLALLRTRHRAADTPMPCETLPSELIPHRKTTVIQS